MLSSRGGSARSAQRLRPHVRGAGIDRRMLGKAGGADIDRCTRGKAGGAIKNGHIIAVRRRSHGHLVGSDWFGAVM